MAETKVALQAIQAALKKYGTRQIVESAQILSSPNARRAEILLNSSLRDFAQDTKRRITTYKSFSSDREDDIEWTTEEKDDYVSSVAHTYVDGQKIVFRSCESKKAAKKRHFVERWSRSALIDSLEVTAKHGAFYNDSTFGGVSFHSKIHSRLAYVAEAKKPEDDSFLKFEYEDEWGEGFAEKANPIVVVLDFENTLSEHSESKVDDAKDKKTSDYDDSEGKVVVMTGPKDSSCSQPVFGPDEGKLIWVAVSTKPRRYGALFCPNRRSSIMYSDYDGSNCQNLTQDYDHARSPVFGGDEEIYFLTNPLGGPHFHCSELHSYNFKEKRCSAVVKAVKTPAVNGFTGIYTDRLSYIHGGEIIANSICRSTNCAYSLSSEHGTAKELIQDRQPEDSWVAIGAGKGQVVLSKAAPDGSTEIVLRNLSTDSTFSVMQSPALSKLTMKIINYPDRPNLESILMLPPDFSNSLFKTTSSDKPPLIVTPHGGPHGTYTTRFDPWMASMLELGIAILSVNYTGSTGFGKDSIDGLVGRIGELDVSDVQFAKDQASKSGLIDETRMGIMGGSHGGFLTAWLVGKYPDDYKCAVLRNPVIGLASCGAGSDIPDWACAETGVEFNLDKPPLITTEVYEKLWKASPMSVAEHVKAPVFMAIGGKDQRVPPYEGLNWIKFLRSRGHENARCFRYPEDGHRLDSGDAFKHGFEAIALFLKEFL